MNSKDKFNINFKPNNLLIFGNVLKIADFGLTGKRGGTSLFCSPEQIVDQTVSEKCDIFGLSAVLLFIFCEYENNINTAHNFLLSYFEDPNMLKMALADARLHCPILLTLKSGFQYKPTGRPNLENLKKSIENWENSGKSFIAAKFLAKAVNFQTEFEYQNLGR